MTEWLEDKSLNARELAILKQVARGLTNKEIATDMCLSEKSVEHMLGNSDPYRAIYPKIGVNTRSQAVAWYVIRFGIPNNDESKTEQDLLELEIDSLKEVFTDQYETIYQVRIQGNPSLAVERANVVANWMRKVLRRLSPSASTRALVDVLALILLEQGRAYREVLPYSRILPSTLQTVESIRGLADLSDRNNDRTFRGLIDFSLGDAHFIRAEYERAESNISTGLLMRALKTLESGDEQLQILREITINGARKNDKKLVDVMQQEAKRIIDQGSFNRLDQAVAYIEGLARAQVLLASEDAIQSLEEAWAWYRKLEAESGKAPLRKVQIIRTNLEVIRIFEPTDKRSIENLGEEARRLAVEHGYSRHAKHIGELLNLELN